jgi:hypothetical protein
MHFSSKDATNCRERIAWCIVTSLISLALDANDGRIEVEEGASIVIPGIVFNPKNTK